MFRDYVARDDKVNALYNHLKPSNLRPYLFRLVTICTPCTEDTQGAILVDLSLYLCLCLCLVGWALGPADLLTPNFRLLNPNT